MASHVPRPGKYANRGNVRKVGRAYCLALLTKIDMRLLAIGVCSAVGRSALGCVGALLGLVRKTIQPHLHSSGRCPSQNHVEHQPASSSPRVEASSFLRKLGAMCCGTALRPSKWLSSVAISSAVTVSGGRLNEGKWTGLSCHKVFM